MKQFQLTYQNYDSFCKELEKIKQWCSTNPAYTTLFRIYSDDMDIELIQQVCDILDEKMPDALYLGATTHANLMDGAIEKAHIILSCTVFEYETTQVKVLQLPFTEEKAKDAVQELKVYCEENPWVSSVEMHVTMLGMSVREFCDEMGHLPSNIQVFGGGAYNPDMNGAQTFVFSKGNGFSEHSIVFLLLGGRDLHTYSTYIAGWKPLTRAFKVTKADGALLQELDGAPAFDVYQNFFKITKDNDLISNTLEFPLFMDYKGLEVLRCPLGVNDEGALMMATEVPENSEVRIAYGDPETILRDIRRDGQKIAHFQPEAIQTFSCAARRAFWGDENVSDETVLLNSIAPTSGFYTVGEFIRTNGAVRNFNITLVLAAMREGEPKHSEVANLYDTRMGNIESEERIPLIRRFVSFIEATTAELEEVNKRLAIASITDGLTNLFNRTETENRIARALDKHLQRNTEVSLIMLDIDDFKRINDVHGHKEGDKVIIALSDVLRKVMSRVKSSVIGRWGGEEFMILLPLSNIQAATALAEKIRKEFSAITHEKAGPQTVSVGVTQARNDDTPDSLYNRVDNALYMAKENGKNRVVRLD